MTSLIHVHSKDAVRDLLKSEQFSAYPMIEAYEQIQSKTGLDFRASLQLLRCLPLFLTGQGHQEVRRAMAVKLASVQATQRNAVREEIEGIAARLQPGIELDLIGELSLPLWRSTSQCILPRGSDLSGLIENITTLFYPTLSLRKRLQINDGIQRYIDNCNENVSEQLTMLSMAALGARPFVGSFALSVYDIASNNEGRALSDIIWPDSLTSSSLRFVDRTATTQMSRHGIDFEAGDRVRCHTHESVFHGHSNVEALFGYGSHVCLGRTISEYCWRLLAERLSRLSVRLLPLECRMDAHTEPFTMPVVARVRVA
jgi:cytochrome P450